MGDIDGRFWLLAAALLIDAIVGEPRLIWRRFRHPVEHMGAGIDWLDRHLNWDWQEDGPRAAAGLFAALIILVGGLLVGFACVAVLEALPYAGVIEAVIVAVLLAGRGLYDHVAAVAKRLEAGGLAGGREAVRHIVGRDPESLDEAGVARAGIETLAENFADGVVAPAFWYLVFGLPGLVACKAINTGDSMIGHRTARHAAFGRATARFDDAINWIPARLSGLLIAAAATILRQDWRQAFAAMWNDAGRHRSVNAGWPEAAMAGALGLGLAGPRSYGGERVDDAVMNSRGTRHASAADIRSALVLYIVAGGLALALTVLAASIP